MSLSHNFYIVPKKVISEEQIINEKEIKQKCDEKIVFPDNLILYILDSLKWIPSINPTKSENGYSINYYGITLFKENAIEKFIKIMDAWISLFNIAPINVELKGNYLITEKKAGYERIKYKKDELLDTFTTMKIFLEKAKENEMYIIHFGI